MDKVLLGSDTDGDIKTKRKIVEIGVGWDLKEHLRVVIADRHEWNSEGALWHVKRRNGK